MVQPAAHRLATAVAWTGIVWFAFVALWGVAQIPPAGHIGAGAAGTTMMAEGSLRWHTLYPLFEFYPTQNSYPATAYCHHPFGMYWLSMVFLRLLGHRDIVVFLPAAVQSILTPILLHSTARRAWGPIPAAATVLGFVVLPITTGFATFHNGEVMTIFGAALFFWGHLGYLEEGKKRHLAAALVGAFFAACGDWVGYLIVAPVLAWGLLRGFVLPKSFTPRFDARRQAKLWALSVTVAVATLALFLGLFQRADKIGDWIGSAATRGSRDLTPLDTVLESRATWIDFSFTPLAIAVGKVGAWICGARLLLRRRDEETFALAALFGSVIQYVEFRQAADVHIFWPHYFGLYYALALGQLAATVQWLTGRFLKRHARIAGGVALGIAVLPGLLILPDTVRALRIFRETGGRYDDKGALIRSNADQLFVLEEVVRPNLALDDRIAAAGSAGWGWEQPWAARANADGGDAPDGAHRFWTGRASGAGAAGLKGAAGLSHLRIYGDILIVDSRDAPGPLDAYDMHEREPGPFSWLFTHPTERVRTIDMTPDPFLTWEWRHHLGVAPEVLPTGAAANLGQTRILHNAALSVGNTVEAERLRQSIVDELDRTVEAHWEGGTTLLGVRVIGGVEPRVEMWIEAGGPTAGDTTFGVTSQIVAKNPLSFIPKSDVVRQMAFPPPLSTALWKKGYVYEIDCVLNHRIGTERYVASWNGGPPRRPANAAELVVVTLK